MPDEQDHLFHRRPRSDSTLLADILAPNPRFHLTPAAGIIDMLANVLNHWDHDDALRAMDRHLSEAVKGRTRGQSPFSFATRGVQPRQAVRGFMDTLHRAAVARCGKSERTLRAPHKLA